MEAEAEWMDLAVCVLLTRESVGSKLVAGTRMREDQVTERNGMRVRRLLFFPIHEICVISTDSFADAVCRCYD